MMFKCEHMVSFIQQFFKDWKINFIYSNSEKVDILDVNLVILLK